MRRILVELVDAVADTEVFVLCVRAGVVVSWATVPAPVAPVALPAVLVLQAEPG
jgi:hypothetical protein